ncbi:MAG: acyl-CoA dehydrogenase [Proteobacteria bacterium]|nr:acyl-CoA dehydrogenase [Pseudomonadota bacterium]
MTQTIADRRDIDFVLFEQFEADSLIKSEKYADFTKKMLDMIITEARSFALKEFLPTYKEGDREGVRLENGAVTVPECYRRAHKLYQEGEWLALTQSPEYGGQGLPHVIAQAVFEYLIGSNYTLTMYGILACGSGKLIELYGSQKIKDLFLQNVYSGKWGGTMLLTEPQAGSDLGSITTQAVSNGDGTYSLKGNKIFISNGDQNLTENIIHPVLARIQGAPAGTRGISLFLVPKFWVNDDGSIGEFNHITCTGIEEKMGLHGSPTCSMSMGEKGLCRGYLLGEENKGMAGMFQMMNDVRLEVGTQSFAHASAAYLYAVDYATQRLQGRKLGDTDLNAPQVPIVHHPDVRRMLMSMKAYVEGMRSFTYYVALCFDKAACAETDAQKQHYTGLIDILTPVVKSYCSEKGFDVCVQAMQVFGGYGYTKDYPIEQILRDCKICSIYEGSNGIQAMDFLGRKLGMNNGQVFLSLSLEIEKTIAMAKTHDPLFTMAQKLGQAMETFKETALLIARLASSKNFDTAFLYAHPLMEVTGDLVMAWMLLWRATVAITRTADKKQASFYQGQIKSAEYFIHAMIPITLGKMESIKNCNDAAISIREDAFAG